MNNATSPAPATGLINLSTLVETWERAGEWSVAPAYLDWIKAGNLVKVGKGVLLHTYETVLCNAIIIGSNCYLGPDCTLDDNVRLRKRVTLTAYVGVRANAVIGTNTTLQAGTLVGQRAKLCKHVLVEAGCTVGDDCQIMEGATVKRDVPQGVIVL